MPEYKVPFVLLDGSNYATWSVRTYARLVRKKLAAPLGLGAAGLVSTAATSAVAASSGATTGTSGDAATTSAAAFTPEQDEEARAMLIEGVSDHILSSLVSCTREGHVGKAPSRVSAAELGAPDAAEDRAQTVADAARRGPHSICGARNGNLQSAGSRGHSIPPTNLMSY